MAVQLKRVYDEPAESDGFRVLVDRLWPRGVTRERASIDLWLKDVAPSPDLRTQWHSDPGGFEEYAGRYRVELEQNPATEELRDLIAGHPTVTLLYGAKDPVFNHARVLADFLVTS